MTQVWEKNFEYKDSRYLGRFSDHSAPSAPLTPSTPSVPPTPQRLLATQKLIFSIESYFPSKNEINKREFVDRL